MSVFGECARRRFPGCDAAIRCLFDSLLPRARARFPRLRRWVVEDTLSDAVSETVRRGESFDRCEDARKYAAKAAFRKLRRESRRAEERALVWDREDPDSRVASESIEAADVLEAFLSRLASRDRLVVRRLFEGERVSKIAEELRSSERTLERRIARLKARFEAFLEAQSR